MFTRHYPKLGFCFLNICQEKTNVLHHTTILQQQALVVSSVLPETYLSQRATLYSITFNNSTYQCSEWPSGTGGSWWARSDSSIYHGLEQMGTGRGKEGWARVSSSESTATRRHSANGGGVQVPEEVDLAHASFSCLQKYGHMFARAVIRHNDPWIMSSLHSWKQHL